MSFKLIKFNNGNYGVLWQRLFDKKFMNLNTNYFNPERSSSDPDCQGTEEQAHAVMLRLQGKDYTIIKT